MTLQAPMQGRARQMRNGWLQGIKAVIQRQQRMAPKGNDRRLLGLRQHGGARIRRPGLHVLDRRPLPPRRHRLGIDAEFPAQLRERSLRSLYRSSDGVRGRGAPVTNLSHSASFLPCEKISPSNRGIKHLGPRAFWSGRLGALKQCVQRPVDAPLTSGALALSVPLDIADQPFAGLCCPCDWAL